MDRERDVVRDVSSPAKNHRRCRRQSARILQISKQNSYENIYRRLKSTDEKRKCWKIITPTKYCIVLIYELDIDVDRFIIPITCVHFLNSLFRLFNIALLSMNIENVVMLF